jgi:hypothetical protein
VLLSAHRKVSSAPKLMSRHWVLYAMKKYTDLIKAFFTVRLSCSFMIHA